MSDNNSIFPISTTRDVRIFQLNPDQVLVIGCDSSGGIGPKPLDKLKVDGFTLGKFTARVALMEIMSVGAKPQCIVDNLCVELEPTGLEILKGIRSEAVQAGLDPNLAVTGSAEKNFAVEQTGIGITAIGLCDKKKLRIGKSKTSDAVVSIGTPCVGFEVIVGEEQQTNCTIDDLVELDNLNFVHDIIPVGSTGLKHEVEVLEDSSGLKFLPNKSSKVDLLKSAGPATVLLVSLPVSDMANLRKKFSKPIDLIGSLFEN